MILLESATQPFIYEVLKNLVPHASEEALIELGEERFRAKLQLFRKRIEVARKSTKYVAFLESEFDIYVKETLPLTPRKRKLIAKNRQLESAARRAVEEKGKLLNEKLLLETDVQHRDEVCMCLSKYWNFV